MDMQLSQTAMICLTIVLALGVLGLIVVLWKAIHMAGDKEPAVFTTMFGQGNAVRLLTVLLIISAATYLSLARLLDQAVISLFAGIAGFVLGGITRPERK